MSAEDRYVFVAEWYDQQSSLLRKFYLGYYLSDKTIDLVSPNAVLLYLPFELLSFVSLSIKVSSNLFKIKINETSIFS